MDEAVGRGVVDDGNSHQRYGYRAPGFNFEARLIYNESRLVLEHLGIGSRVLERGSPAATNLRSLD